METIEQIKQEKDKLQLELEKIHKLMLEQEKKEKALTKKGDKPVKKKDKSKTKIK